MDSLSDAIGASQTIELQGKSYKLGQLTLGDLADFEVRTKHNVKQLRKEKMETAKEMFGAGNVPAEIFREIVGPVTEDELDRESGTIDGVAFLISRALKHGGNELTEDQVRDMVTPAELPDLLKAIGLDKEGTDSKKKVMMPTM